MIKCPLKCKFLVQSWQKVTLVNILIILNLVSCDHFILPFRNGESFCRYVTIPIFWSTKELIRNVKFGLFCRYISLSCSKQLQMGAFLVPPLPTNLGGWLKLSKPAKNELPVLIDSIESCLHVRKINSYFIGFFFHYSSKLIILRFG